ncbi:uncharacterized protein LOC128882908 [Hylaeus volcanicus]|uniref:uncharacterized protein LOC128882908 n=1 Tax=Hylaeus volcanicus TaxID=313075 RepID=UPI0023B7C268|nr:uncharacterized protein LOC128882908 [Hylaeus volcanicus]
MSPYYQYEEQVHTNRKDMMVMPVYSENEEMHNSNRYTGFTEYGMSSWVKQTPDNQPIQNTSVPSSYTEFINPSNLPNPLQNSSTIKPTIMKQRGPNNVRYQPFQITQTSLTQQDTLSWFCTQCNYPMICRIRLSPCYHLICISCFLQICTEKSNKCFCCSSVCSFAEALHHQDEVFTCSGSCYGYKQKVKGRSFLNQVSLKAHELFFHMGESNECLSNQEEDPRAAAPVDLMNGAHQYTESTCDPYSTSPSISGELQGQNTTTYVPELPSEVMPFEKTENLTPIPPQSTFNLRHSSSQYTEVNKAVYHDTCITDIDVSNPHLNNSVRKDSGSANYLSNECHQYINEFNTVRRTNQGIPFTEDPRVNFRNSNPQLMHASMSGRHIQCTATPDPPNAEFINPVTLSNIPYPTIHQNSQPTSSTAATQNYAPVSSSYDVSHNLSTTLNIDPPKKTFYMSSEVMHPTNFKNISNQPKSNLSIVLDNSNQQADFEYLF